MIENQPEGKEVERYKVILLGDAGVGKTSLCRRYTENTFDFKMNPTIGSSHIRTRVNVEGRSVELMIWDTAGQEQFASLVPLYSRNTDVCLVVASVVNSDSCNHIMTWIKRINDSGVYPSIVVAINKVDLVEDQPPSIDEIRKKYTQGIDYIFLTSARTGSGIEQLFQQVASDAINFHKKDQKDDNVQLADQASKESKGCC